MTQRTLVLKVPRARHRALRDGLEGGDFEFRRVPHAVFSAKGAGCVLTLYESGKLVVQGAEPELFLARYTDLDVPVAEATRQEDPVQRIDGPLVGSDEAGKGDYFGPLVVAAVRVEPEEAAELNGLGIADSKTLTDDRALRLAAGLRSRLPHAIERLDPESYNRTYPRFKSLNPLLADLHARAIRAVAHTGDRVLVDQFANPKLMRSALAGTDIDLHQATRAERNLAVAAASILARAEFLLGLHELSQAFGIELRKGAGAPTDRAALDFARQHGVEELPRVAKMHFKNTQKLQNRLG